MRRQDSKVRLTCYAIVVTSTCLATTSFAATPPTSLSSLRVPPGFEVERVATAPLVKYPMLGTFDDRGRLFVCESVGENLDAKQLLKRLPNFVRMLEDTNGDGRFDKSTIFADKMTLPSGAMWHDGALYVASPPSIWRLQDTDGDGVADRRDELVRGFKFRGHAGDVHGPYLGPNGRLFFVDGYMGHEIRDKQGKLLSKGRASRVFSTRLDGSDLQTFCGGGMANLVAATFNEAGELFGVATFFHYDSRRIRHDAFFHCVYGGVYPRRLSLLRDEFKLSGRLLPALTEFGMSAPSSLTCYRSKSFGADYRGNIFVSHFNTRTVSRARMTRTGASFRAGYEPFLTSSNPDFHPCDVIEDADGSLLVIDTGGWFKIGCPTSTRQPNVLGGIYRIRRKGQVRIADSRGLKINWKQPTDQLIRLLDDPRFAVRDRAVATIAKRGDSAVPSLRRALASGTQRLRRNAIWALTRIGSSTAVAASRQGLNDQAAQVRLVAGKCAATHRDPLAVKALTTLLKDGDAAVRRQAATALGRIGSQAAVRPLLKSIAGVDDPMLEHAIVFALIQIGDRATTQTGLKNDSAKVQRAALIALDQMENGQLTRQHLAALQRVSDVDLQEAVLDVVTRHPKWFDLVEGQLKLWLSSNQLTSQRRTLLRGSVYALRREAACQTLMATMLTTAGTSAEVRKLLMAVMIDSGFAAFPEHWQRALFHNLKSKNDDVARQAFAAMASTTSRQFDAGLRKFANDQRRSVPLRVRALRVLARNQAELSPAAFALLHKQMSPDARFDSRLDAARAIANSKLSSGQTASVIELVAQAGPVELPLLIQPLDRVWQDESGRSVARLLAALENSPGFASLTEQQISAVFKKAPAKVRAAAAPLIQRVKAEYATSIREILRTTFSVVGGDPKRGKKIFFSKQTLCSECHRSGKGPVKDIGPDLSRIGEVRGHRDLLESILLPSQSFARGFESKTVVTKAGRVYSGVIRKETGDSLTLYTAQRKEVRIARSDVAKVSISKISIMPKGLERSLTSDDLRDLLAYLKSLRRTKKQTDSVRRRR